MRYFKWYARTNARTHTKVCVCVCMWTCTEFKEHIVCFFNCLIVTVMVVKHNTQSFLQRENLINVGPEKINMYFICSVVDTKVSDCLAMGIRPIWQPQTCRSLFKLAPAQSAAWQRFHQHWVLDSLICSTDGIVERLLIQILARLPFHSLAFHACFCLAVILNKA